MLTERTPHRSRSVTKNLTNHHHHHLFAREQYSKQVQMTVKMSRTIRRKDTHLQMPLNLPPQKKKIIK